MVTSALPEDKKLPFQLLCSGTSSMQAFTQLTTPTFVDMHLKIDPWMHIRCTGAHTLGFAHCFVIQNRLYSSNGSAITDPTMSKSLARNLRRRCPQPFYDRVRPEAGSLLDLSSPDEFDNRYFSNLQQSSGVLSSDQLLYTGSSTTKRLVDQLALSQVVFFDNFVNSMIKLSKAGVLTGTEGEVRLNCRRPNAQQSTPASPRPPAVTSTGDPPLDLAAAAPPV